MKHQAYYRTILTILCFCFGVFALFFHLETPLLWEDEGEVAVLARNINIYGLPVTWDGTFFITQENGQDSTLVGNHYIWSWNTWLPYYAVALSFRLLGESTFSARLPFAIAGMGILFLYVLLIRVVFRNHKVITLFALATLVSNTLFYLYVRQARYYAFTMFFSLGAFYFFFLFQNTKKIRYACLYFLCILLNFHSNFVLSMGLTLPLIIYPFFQLLAKKRSVLLIPNTVFLLQSFLWVVYFKPASQGSEAIGFYRYWGGLRRVGEKLYNHSNLINSFYFPLSLVILLLLITVLFKRKQLRPGMINYKFTLILTGIFTHMVVISYFLQFGQKYLLSLIPIFSLIMGYLLSSIYDKSKIFSIGILLLSMFTNIPFLLSERILHPSFLFSPVQIRSYIVDHLSSLSQEYNGPVEGAVHFFRREGITQAAIYTDYEVDSLKFYLPDAYFVNRDLALVKGKPQAVLSEKYRELTEFYIPRKFWGDLGKIGECEKHSIKEMFIKHTLVYYDLEWNNLPDITYHKFVLDSDLPPLIIYEKPDVMDFSSCKENTI